MPKYQPSSGQTVDTIAAVCHEANRQLQRQLGEVVNFPWESTSEDLRNSLRSGVQGFLEDGVSARQSHVRWVKYKLAEGWAYGPIKDFKTKTHPLLVKWEELTDEQQAKDLLFIGICKALTEKL
jgi:hypothetical protein